MSENLDKHSGNKMAENTNADKKMQKDNMKKNPGKNPMKALCRLLRYVLKEYKLACITVVVSILISALAILSISMFM